MVRNVEQPDLHDLWRFQDNGKGEEINQEIGVFRAFAHQFVHIAQVVRRVGLGDLRIESGHEIVGELGYRTLEFDGHIPRRIDLHAEKQVHQDIDSLGVEDEEPVPDEGPPGEGGHLPRNPFFDQPGAEPAFLELTLGVDAVQDPDDECDGEHQDGIGDQLVARGVFDEDGDAQHHQGFGNADVSECLHLFMGDDGGVEGNTPHVHQKHQDRALQHPVRGSHPAIGDVHFCV